MSVLEPLRQEHRELLPDVESLRTAADRVGSVAPDVLACLVDKAAGFLTHHLIPHARAEDAALYPVVDEVMGASGATATMRREHVEVAEMTAELEGLRARLLAGEAVDNDLRRVLYGLYTLVRVHFAEEEDVYLPLLEERLSPDAAARMLTAMHHAAHA